MKALLIKDYYNFKIQYLNKKSIFAMALVYLIVMYFSGFETSTTYLSTLTYIFLMFNFSMDTQAGAISYAKGLPIPAKKIVFSKYLLSFIAAGILLLITSLFYFILRPLGLAGDLSLVDSLYNLLYLSTAVIVVNILLLPMIFKFGAKFWLVFILFFLIGMILLVTGLFESWLAGFMTLTMGLRIFLALLGIIILFLISFAISVKIVKNY